MRILDTLRGFHMGRTLLMLVVGAVLLGGTGGCFWHHDDHDHDDHWHHDHDHHDDHDHDRY